MSEKTAGRSALFCQKCTEASYLCRHTRANIAELKRELEDEREVRQRVENASLERFASLRGELEALTGPHDDTHEHRWKGVKPEHHAFHHANDDAKFQDLRGELEAAIELQMRTKNGLDMQIQATHRAEKERDALIDVGQALGERVTEAERRLSEAERRLSEALVALEGWWKGQHDHALPSIGQCAPCEALLDVARAVLASEGR